jgi:hypothetical protein
LPFQGVTAVTAVTAVLGYAPTLSLLTLPHPFLCPKRKAADRARRKPCHKGVQRERLAHFLAVQGVVCYTL